MKYLIAAFIVLGCKPPTPAQDVQILKAELAITDAKCALYALQPKYPRDAYVTEKCNKLLTP